jgi:drug/metabolite transporter (DMT)-like permease
VVSRKFGTGTEVTALTLACTVFALISITAGTLYQKRFMKPTDVRTANVIQLAAAFVVTLPLALFETEAITWNVHFLGAMAWSVLALTLGGSSLLYLLIQRGAATSVTSLLYLVPPTTALMAWLLFDEPITVTTVIGTALTALGVSLVVRPRSRRPRSFPGRALELGDQVIDQQSNALGLVGAVGRQPVDVGIGHRIGRQHAHQFS